MNQNHGKAVKITEEIFQVGRSQLTSSDDAAIYLINSDGHAALVDGGCGDAQKRLIANIRSCGVTLEQVEYIFITHCHYDHTGGVKALNDLLKCQIVSHEFEAPFLEQKILRYYRLHLLLLMLEIISMHYLMINTKTNLLFLPKSAIYSSFFVTLNPGRISSSDCARSQMLQHR